RKPRPDADTHRLLTSAILLRHQDSNVSQQAASDFQIPAVIVSSTPEDGPVGAQRGFEGTQSFFRSQPALAPEPERSPPWKREARAVAPPPGRQPETLPAPQARQGLEQVQERRQDAEPQPSQPGWRVAPKANARYAAPDRYERQSQGQGGQRERRQQRPPKVPDPGKRGEAETDQVPLRHQRQ